MLLTILSATSALGLAFTALKLSKWRQNYCIAKATGLKVFLSPIHLTDTWWLALYPLLVPWLNLLPQQWKTPWLPMSQIFQIWKQGHQPFGEVTCDTFILATPRGNMVWTCDPLVIHQAFTQNTVCQMPADLTTVYNIYGPNIGSSEGDEWKKHRRVVTAGFNPGTSVMTWNESIYQTSTLVDHWLEEGVPIRTMREWTCRLALHVISTAFFSKRMGWNNYTDDHVPAPPGHKISFEEAIHTVIARLGLIFMTPKALLGRLPFKACKEAHLAYTEWKSYMIELRDEALSRLDEIESKPIRNLLESIVTSGELGHEKSESQALPKESVIPNIFFTIFAGHETTGNTMSFLLILLAIYPDCQIKLQQQLDDQLSGRTPDEWTIEKDYPALLRGYLGAVMNESMRIYNVVPWMARRTVANMPITDSLEKKYEIPTNTLVLLGIAAMFRNPNRWSDANMSPGRKSALHNSPAMNFDPSRWLDDDGMTCNSETPDFIPFGVGPRICPGKALAQIEMTATIATLFKGHSLELVVSEQTIRAYNGDSKLAWEETRDAAIRMIIDDIDSNTNIRLRKDLPIRVVKRQ